MSVVPAPSVEVCPSRTPAVRRALLTLLFLGGVLLLALAFGDRARAAQPPVGGGQRTTVTVVEGGSASRATAGGTDAVDGVPSSMGSAVDTALGTVDRAADAASSHTTPGVPSGAGQAARTLPRPGAEPADRQQDALDGLRQPVESSTAAVTEGVRRATGPVLATVESLLAGLTGTTPDDPDQDGAHGGDDGRYTTPRPAPRQPAGGCAPDDDRSTLRPVPPSFADVSWPAPAGGDPTDRRGQQGPDGNPLPSAPVPVSPSPSAPPGPAGACHGAHDGNGPRDDQQQAALLTDEPRFGLARGAVTATEGTPTRERHRDVLEFPG